MYNSTILTLIISIILREIKSAEALEIMADLPKHFKVFTYGDDNIMSFSHSLRKILDPRLITDVMNRFGHTYTNDAKDGKELEYKTMSEISILKRTFSYDTTHGWIAPLDLVSIMECLNWDKVDKKDMERKRAQTIVNMRVAIRELSLHPQLMFEKYRGEILTTAKRHNLVLPPECSFSQEDLRVLTLCGDNLFYFSDDLTVHFDHRLRQGIYLEQDENEFNQVQDLWPRLECKQGSAQQEQYSNNNQSAATSQQQITTFDQETSFIRETQPAQRNLSEDKFFQFEEVRDHTIKDILCRVYDIADVTIPTGGLPGDIVYTLNPFATFLSQTNVRAKLAAFAAFRANLVVRANVTTARTGSGALLFSYIPPLGTQRATTLLQQSQSLRHDSPVSAGEEVDLLIPWVDAFLARSLSTNTGDLGTYRISRITPTATDLVRIRIQIFCPEKTLRIEYPTFMAQFTTREQLMKEKERLDFQIRQTMEGPRFDAHAPVARMEMKSLRHIIANINKSMPKQSPSEAPLKAVKWQPGAGALNDTCETPMHVLTVNKNQQVETDSGQFGSGADEMDVEHIMNTPNIISVFPFTSAQIPGTVIYARPCTITDFIGSTTSGVTTMSISHQTYMASLAQQWSATLNFKIKGSHNQFHSFKLKSMFVPNDTGKYTVGQVMSFDDTNAVKGEIHEFGADKMIGEHTIKPMLSTNMKNVPSPRNAAGVASLANYTANQFTQECSYGMFYIMIHTGMVLSSQVASTVHMYIDFHASDVILSEAETYLYLFPQTQMKGIEGESNVQARDETKSTSVITPETATTDEKAPREMTTIKQSLGESIHNLRQLTSAMTVFANSFTNAATTAFMIAPFTLRTTSSQIPADIGQYNDHIDYISSAFAFRKGGMIITFGRRSADNTPFGEMILVGQRNNFSGTTLANIRGFFTFTAPNSASSGARVLPLYGEECMPRVLVPFIQPFVLNRTSNGNLEGFDNGANNKFLILRPYSTAINIRVYRSAAQDFRLGFLTSLPQYTLNIANVFT
nr:MAG: capsid protein [Crogonang virus 64]